MRRSLSTARRRFGFTISWPKKLTDFPTSARPSLHLMISGSKDRRLSVFKFVLVYELHTPQPIYYRDNRHYNRSGLYKLSLMSRTPLTTDDHWYSTLRSALITSRNQLKQSSNHSFPAAIEMSHWVFFTYNRESVGGYALCRKNIPMGWATPRSVPYYSSVCKMVFLWKKIEKLFSREATFEEYGSSSCWVDTYASRSF